jgi:hypothetical protein
MAGPVAADVFIFLHSQTDLVKTRGTGTTFDFWARISAHIAVSRLPLQSSLLEPLQQVQSGAFLAPDVVGPSLDGGLCAQQLFGQELGGRLHGS